MKNEGYVIVSDYISTDTPAVHFNQNWHFMPGANPVSDYDNHITTTLGDGDIELVCPDADTVQIEEDTFSSGYGMAEKSEKVTFTKYGQNACFTTLLLPFKGEEKPRVSAFSFTPVDGAISGGVFDIGTNKGVFYTQNTCPQPFLDCTFDGDMAFLLNGRMFLANGSKLCINSTPLVENPADFKDLYIHISSGIVEISSASVHKSTNREEAIRIHAPKTTHVILNGESIPFTLYSDYVYAVAPN